MAESWQKNVVTLRAGATLQQVDAYYLAGMRIACLDGKLDDAELARLCALVKETFYAHNDPIGLMLHVQPGAQVAETAIYQYILLSGFTPADAANWLRETAFEGTVLAQTQSLSGWEGIAQGVYTGCELLALEARRRGLLVLTGNDAIKSDGFLWEADADLEAIAAKTQGVIWDDAFIQEKIANAQGAQLLGAAAVQLAKANDAKAILILSTDGSNLSSVSALYPPVPVIAIAKRPERESMLLQQTMRWATLPTAITRTPESMDVEAFARFVAELYGYEKGDSFVALGHWVEGQNQEQLCCFTL